jgi:hypothetical protein
MSTFPDNLRTLKRYFVGTTGRKGENFSVRGFVGAKRNSGYHLGQSDIFGPGGQGKRDYSIQRPRDREPFLTNDASAIDITLEPKDMRNLTAKMEQAAKAGLLDVQEFLGPGPDGRAYWWDRRNGFEPVQLSKGNSHEKHIHVSYPRKRIAEGQDLVAEWEVILGPRPNPLPPDDTDPEPEPEDPPDAEELRALLAEAEAALEKATDDLIETRQRLVEMEQGFAVYMADVKTMTAAIRLAMTQFDETHGGTP